MCTVQFEGNVNPPSKNPQITTQTPHQDPHPRTQGKRMRVTFYDDYAHHPTEVSATLSGARVRHPAAEIWLVLQPHMHERLAAFLPQFANALARADRVFVTDVYAARGQDQNPEDLEGPLGTGPRELAAAVERLVEIWSADPNLLTLRRPPGDPKLAAVQGD